MDCFNNDDDENNKQNYVPNMFSCHKTNLFA